MAALPANGARVGGLQELLIAAASVLAKVTRDRMMVEMDGLYPGYGFAEHKGYATPQHYAAIRERGPCPIHRRSFSPFRPVNRDELFPADAGAPGGPPRAGLIWGREIIGGFRF